MVLYELAERRAPFDHLMSRFDIVDCVLRGGRPGVSSSLLHDQPAFRSLMERCWSQRPEERPTFLDIVSELERLYALERAENKRLDRLTHATVPFLVDPHAAAPPAPRSFFDGVGRLDSPSPESGRWPVGFAPRGAGGGGGYADLRMSAGDYKAEYKAAQADLAPYQNTPTRAPGSTHRGSRSSLISRFNFGLGIFNPLPARAEDHGDPRSPTSDERNERWSIS
jgi:hypothetical protein